MRFKLIKTIAWIHCCSLCHREINLSKFQNIPSKFKTISIPRIFQFDILCDWKFIQHLVINLTNVLLDNLRLLSRPSSFPFTICNLPFALYNQELLRRIRLVFASSFAISVTTTFPSTLLPISASPSNLI